MKRKDEEVDKCTWNGEYGKPEDKRKYSQERRSIKKENNARKTKRREHE